MHRPANATTKIDRNHPIAYYYYNAPHAQDAPATPETERGHDDDRQENQGVGHGHVPLLDPAAVAHDDLISPENVAQGLERTGPTRCPELLEWRTSAPGRALRKEGRIRTRWRGWEGEGGGWDGRSWGQQRKEGGEAT